MISAYLVVKFVHVLCSTLLLGTGLGAAIFLFAAYRSRRADFLRATAYHVVIVDWIVVAPTVIVQLVTGIWLTSHLNVAFNSVWFVSVLGLFFFTGVCWLPIAWIQFQLSHLAAGSVEDLASPSHVRDRKLMRVWAGCNVLAFALLFALFWMMVFKQGMATPWF
jgi:uncharacterized membrane protein